MDEFNTTIGKISPYVTSIYNKIAAKGGTVPSQKNLHNIAIAIQSIPNIGPGPGDLSDWGIIYTPAYPTGKALASEADWNMLISLPAASGTYNFSFGNVPKNDITRIEWGSKPTSIPDFRLGNFSGLKTVSDIPSNIVTIGSSFLANCSSLNCDITFPASITYIGYSLIYYCPNFTGTLTFNCPASVLDTYTNNSIAEENKTAPMITQGVHVKGTYAQAWMDLLPNNLSGPQTPFRHLILG